MTPQANDVAMGIFKQIFYSITGGRPMEKLDEEGFWDSIGGVKVNFYKDGFGRKWMALGKWSLFRVKSAIEKEGGGK